MGDPPRSPTPNNFYSILGIPKNATLTDICKAYKSLVMKWHPDRNSSNKSEAEAKFRSINEAYRALSTKKREEEFVYKPQNKLQDLFDNNETKDETSFDRRQSPLSRSSSRRSHAPLPSPRSLSDKITNLSPSDFHTTISRSSSSPATSATSPSEPSFLSRMTSRRNENPIIFSQSTARKKPPPIEKKLECSLEELCRGCSKKIKITRDVISNTGKIIQEEEILRIKVKPGWKKGTKITFEGKGDEKPGTLPADIIFIIDEKGHPLFKREGDDLELGVEIPLVQALTGCTINIPLLVGEDMTLSIDDLVYPGFQKIIPDQGMPKPKEDGRRGDLRLKFMVEFPTELSDEQRSDLVNVLQDCT